ncbi:MAG: glycosyltransferase, partial [Anaerolineae bacterium]|nr:glycosyltransferase [Anaerolineae bacterium]
MRVEFVSPYNHSPKTGIGRYMHTLKSHLERSIEVSVKPMRFAPFSSRLSFLRNFPLAIEGHVPGSIVHIPQIMGCAMMLYRPYHPSVATVHDLGFFELPEEGHTLDPLARRLLNWSLAGLKRVDKIVAVSEFTRHGIIKHLGIPAE